MSAVREGSSKLHVLREGSLRGLPGPSGSLAFDLASDPDEQQPLAAEPRQAQGIHDLLDWLATAAAALQRATEDGVLDLEHMDPEVRLTLEQLGYVNGQRGR
jgi:hypothetical protein